MTAVPTAPFAAAYASRIDAAAHGEFRPAHRAVARWDGRITSPVAGRYHVYGAWSCAATHRVAIVRALAGIDGAVSMSYVDGLRDARGWAFRAGTGADPVNGFTLLREAYLATDPHHDGPVTVPVLWDRATRRIVSNAPAGIGTELITAFGAAEMLRPAAYLDEIEATTRVVGAEIAERLARAVYDQASAQRLRNTLTGFDGRLARRRFVVGDRLTDADVALWVQLVRYDAGPNAHGAAGPRLDAYPNLWRWACALWAHPAFAAATDLTRIAVPFADLPPWPAGRPAA